MTCRGSVRLLLAVANLLAGARLSSAALSVADPRCEGLREAPQVDTTAPRFSWRLVADERDVVQTACQLRVTEVDARGRPLGTPLESARLESDETQWVVLPGFAARARATYAWQVRAWDNHGNASEWTEPRRFGTGLLGERWPGDWVGDGRALGLFETAPARHFRGTFRLEHLPVRARLYVSALGLVEPWLNGSKVTEDQFVPGWPDYRRRVFYAAYDVAHLLRRGDNTLGMVLGDGWYSGTMIPHHQYGPQAMLSAFLDLADAQGGVTTLTTGEGWRWTDAGPITMSSIYHGETYDARRELAGWSDPRPSADGEGWRPVTVRAGRHTPAAFTARLSPPVRRVETLEPVAVHRRGPDVHVYDLGQNITGWARLRVEAEAGREIKLRFAEMLEPDGGLHTANLRSARATAHYVAKGEGVEEWEPRFTYYGFRYVELSGVERPPEDAIRGVVLHTDVPRTGEFDSSSPLLNRLWRNTLWSQKGNFLELPTDCPQRDERAGWSGDAQVFAPTALYNMDAGPFFRQWLFSLRDGFRDDPHGGYPDVAPYTGFGHGSPGWGEAGVIVPWTVWLHTGDRRVLAEREVPPSGPEGSAGGAQGGSDAAALRWGEHLLRQPVGWYSSRQASALADSVLIYQTPQGGWPKNTDLAALPGSPADVPAPGDGRANTIDNGATTLPMRFLALVAHATGEARYREAFARGVDYLLAAQYANGGWPQFFPLRGDYYSHITYNDGAMVNVLSLLRDAAGGRPPYSFVDEERRARAAAAVARGLDCILRTQIWQGGRLTAWCAQHDEKTLEPAWARPYEPPSLSGGESVGIVRFLMSIESPSPDLIAGVEGAVAWFREVKITGQRLERKRRDDGRTERFLVPDPAAPPLWARFYELGTNRPLYLDRDSVFRYHFGQIGYERRSGYNYHGTWPLSLIERDYPAWREKLGTRSSNPATAASRTG